MQLLSVTGSEAAASTDGSKVNCTCHSKLVKYMLHIAAHIEEPKHPQEVEPALSLPVDSLSVTCQVQSVVQMDSQVLMGLVANCNRYI